MEAREEVDESGDSRGQSMSERERIRLTSMVACAG